MRGHRRVERLADKFVYVLLVLIVGCTYLGTDGWTYMNLCSCVHNSNGETAGFHAFLPNISITFALIWPPFHPKIRILATAPEPGIVLEIRGEETAWVVSRRA